MGELIMLRPRTGQDSQAKAPLESDAKIIFFTGVRYERMVEPREDSDPAPTESVGKPGRGRKRRRG